MKHKLVTIVVDLPNPSKYMAEIKGVDCEGGMKLFEVKVGRGSSLLFGTFGDALGTICFISFHVLYIDLLMLICELASVTNPKYCDIDSSFGLHDYTVSLDMRNSKRSFLCE